MPVYLICEIFSKKYVFDKKHSKKSGILNIRKKRTKKQQKRRKRNARKSNGNGY